MYVISKLLIVCTCKYRGSDEFANKYYEKTRKRKQKRTKRYVLFNGIAEASKVPSDWHGWLHHTQDETPPHGGYSKYKWQDAHLPNLTGTIFAYRPKGHTLNGGKRVKASGDYEPWTPKT